MPTVHFAPTIFSSTNTCESYRSASASAAGQSCDALDELQSDAGTLPHRFDHHRRIPTHRPRRFRRVHDQRSRRRHARRHTTFLRQHFVEANPARLGITARVRHAQLFQFRLHRAVFAIRSVQAPEKPRRSRARSFQPGARGSSSITSCPSERNAVATAAPERSETSRSALGPPSITVMFNFPVIPSSVFPDNFHFGLQFDSAFRLGALLASIAIKSRTSRAVAVPSFTIKLPCSSETIAPPMRVPFNPSSSISLPAGISRRILKQQPALGAAGCDSQRFRLNAFMRCSIASPRGRLAPERPLRGRCDFSAARNSDIRPARPPSPALAHRPAVIHDADGLNHVESRPAHRAGVHAQAPRPHCRECLPEIPAGKPARLASTATCLSFAPAPHCNPLAGNFNRAESRLRQANHHAHEFRHRAPADSSRDPAQKNSCRAPRKISTLPPGRLRTPARHKYPPARRRARWCAWRAVRCGGAT